MNREDLILNLFTERQSADVTFVVEEQEIRVHKAILGAECTYFHTMLFGATNEANATRITLNETPLKQFEEVIRFCYLQKVKIGGWGTDEVCKLLSLAHEYNYGLLLDQIVKEMQNQSMINPVSLPSFHDLAVALNLDNVLNSIRKYVKNHFSLVEKSGEFVSYSAGLVGFLVEIVPNAALNSLWKWKACHTDKEVNQVFDKVAWEVLSSKRLGEVIRVLLPHVKLSEVSEPTEIRTNRARVNRAVANRWLGDEDNGFDEHFHGAAWMDENQLADLQIA